MRPYHPQKNPEYYRYSVDFFARRIHFIDHLVDVYQAMDKDARGSFYIPWCLMDHAQKLGLDAVPLIPKNPRNPIIVQPPGHGPLVTCAYGDMQLGYERNMRRPLILMEHGVGLTFNHPGYAGGDGLRSRVCLFLPPNQYIRRKTLATFPFAPQVVVGTPKMDKWANAPLKKRTNPPTIAIAFHWDGSGVCPEAGNAWQHYKDVLPELKRNYSVIGHGHPKIIDKLAPWYEDHGVEVVRDFNEVLERADVYVNDASSTMYEFAVTGRPVVVLNAPWFRRSVHFGIRFWDFSDIGINCEEPEDLVPAIEAALQDPDEFKMRRCSYVEQLYPNLGYSAQFAADAITEFVKGMRNVEKKEVAETA